MSHGSLLAALVFAGCAASQPPATTHHHSHEGGHAHAHESGRAARDAMFPTLAGDRIVLLTAHLSGAGHELDIYLENRDRAPSPIADQTLTAKVWTKSGERAITFECAPASERPANETGCSHFVAKTPWLDAGETLKIAGQLDASTMRWQGFTPAKYAHHDDRQIASKR